MSAPLDGLGLLRKEACQRDLGEEAGLRVVVEKTAEREKATQGRPIGRNGNRAAVHLKPCRPFLRSRGPPSARTLQLRPRPPRPLPLLLRPPGARLLISLSELTLKLPSPQPHSLTLKACSRGELPAESSLSKFRYGERGKTTSCCSPPPPRFTTRFLLQLNESSFISKLPAQIRVVGYASCCFQSFELKLQLN